MGAQLVTSLVKILHSKLLKWKLISLAFISRYKREKVWSNICICLCPAASFSSSGRTTGAIYIRNKAMQLQCLPWQNVYRRSFCFYISNILLISHGCQFSVKNALSQMLQGSWGDTECNVILFVFHVVFYLYWDVSEYGCNFTVAD